jgi:Pyruvate/2-oxoacid:ferredoxin oxidoreductase delta subunit
MNDKLWYKLATTIVKAGGPPVPINETLIELLKTLINEEQVKFLLHFRKPLNLEQIKDKINMDENSLETILNDLMGIGMLTGIPSRTSGIMVYRLVGFLPGLLEFTLMKGEKGEKQKKLASLWDQLFKDNVELTQKNYDVVVKAFKNAPPIDRVVPMEEQVDVQEEQVLPQEQVKKIIEKFDVIGVSHCYCRHRKDLLEDPCEINAPRKNCLSFGRSAKFAIDHDFAQQITKEEAYRIVKEAEHKGLVHKTFHIKGNPEMEELAICNCCKCCCGHFNSFSMGAAPFHSYTSHIAKIDEELCMGCGTCVEVCPLDAPSLDGEIGVLDELRCMGCGVCAQKCPEHAIELARVGLRKVLIPPPRIKIK